MRRIIIYLLVLKIHIARSMDWFEMRIIYFRLLRYKTLIIKPDNRDS
jgi:hypothetical protein